jgi:hypothetical protein
MTSSPRVLSKVQPTPIRRGRIVFRSVRKQEGPMQRKRESMIQSRRESAGSRTNSKDRKERGWRRSARKRNRIGRRGRKS